MTDDEVVTGTLEWCNKQRAEKQLPALDRLPKGKRDDPSSCPCGNATGLYVDHKTFGETQETRHSRPLPVAVQQFVERFDGGYFPEYDERAIENRVAHGDVYVVEDDPS